MEMLDPISEVDNCSEKEENTCVEN